MGERLEELHQASCNFPEMQSAMDQNRDFVKKVSADCQSSLQGFRTHLDREVCRVVEESRLAHAAQIHSLTSQVQAAMQKGKDWDSLSVKLDRLEEGWSNQQVPWKTMMDNFGKMEETIQNQVRRAMSLQDQKMMEVMMTKMLDGKLREDRNAEYFEVVKADVATSVQGRFSAVLTKLGTDLQAERQKRKELEARVVELSKRPPLARGGVWVFQLRCCPMLCLSLPLLAYLTMSSAWKTRLGWAVLMTLTFPAYSMLKGGGMSHVHLMPYPFPK